ncbi:MAG: NAD(P)H-dependent oxidoreductase subunit E [Actinobacteria bacterium]|jgi:formate dehydrogenase subunit gamma|nr:NAD(P)H-dependent oxidoreductase subunit E [Actinomycetota bacterium]
MSRAVAPWSIEAAQRVLAQVDEPGPVLVALQSLQSQFGYVHADAVALVAERLNVSRADVYGVLTFYSDLRTTPAAEVEVRICLGEACQAVGARALLADAREQLAPDDDVSRVFCMGNCALGPTAVVNGRLLGRASVASVRAAVDGRPT